MLQEKIMKFQISLGSPDKEESNNLNKKDGIVIVCRRVLINTRNANTQKEFGTRHEDSAGVFKRHKSAPMKGCVVHGKKSTMLRLMAPV